MTFIEKLTGISRKNKSLLCVGLDPDPKLMPDKVGVFEFNKAIIDATADLVCAYKPNFAFYEARGEAGWQYLKLIHMKPNIVLYVKLKYQSIRPSATVKNF